jgi:sugar phosphate isomerase/epimerase
MLRLAVATHCFGQPLKSSIRLAAEAGAAGVQLDVRDELPPADLTDTGRRQFLHRLNERGLRIASVTFPLRRPLCDERHLDARMAALRQAMQFAYDLGAPVLTTRIGPIPPDAESTGQQLLRELLNDLARHGNQVGTTLAVSPVGEAPAAIHSLLDSVKAGPIGVDFDPAAFVIGKHSPAQALRDLHRFVVHVQARDAVRESDGGGLEVPLGRGEVDWVELLPLLDEIAYRGWVTVVRTQGDDKLGDIASAIQFLRKVSLG